MLLNTKYFDTPDHVENLFIQVGEITSNQLMRKRYTAITRICFT